VLPASFNPAAGFFATANEMNLPVGYPNEQNKISFEWTDRSRIDRITEMLRDDTRMSLADSMAIQADTVSVQSRRAVALLAPLTSPEREVTEALARLEGWDHDESTRSVAAAIYDVWATKYLGKATVARATPEAARSAILLESLKSALGELHQRLGPDMNTWQWGRLHHATFEPAIAILADPQLRAQMTVGPLQTPGSSSTPRAQHYRASDFAVTAGASVRMVMDVGAWDNSMVINTPGQSADPMNAHYRDLFPLWAEGTYVPLRFSRAAVDADAEMVIHVTPTH
jgi:penicillin G amidase